MRRVPGAFWCSPCAHPDGLGWARVEGAGIADAPNVVIEIAGVEYLRTRAPSTPRFLDICASPAGQLCLASQAQDGGLLAYYGPGNRWLRYPTCYAAPAVRWNLLTRAFEIAVQVTGTTYRLYDPAADKASDELPIPIGLTAGGLTQYLDGNWVWADAVYDRTVRGIRMLATMEAGGLVMGQSPDQPYAIGMDISASGPGPFVALDAQAQRPRLAYDPIGGRWAACSWTRDNAAVYQESPPYQPLPVVIVPTVPDWPPFDWPVSIAPFRDLLGTSGADSEVVTDGAVQAAPRPAWVGLDPDGGTTAIDRAHANGELRGIVCEDHGPGGIEGARLHADRLRTRVAWLHDGSDTVTIPALHPWDEIWPMCYLDDHETLDHARGRWAERLQEALDSPCRDLGLVLRFRVDAFRTDADRIACVTAALRLGASTPRVKVYAPFEYRATTQSPVLTDLFRRLLAMSVHGVPTFEPMVWPSDPVDPIRPLPPPVPKPRPVPDPEGAVMGKVLADLRPASLVRHFLDGYTELDEAPHPDGNGLVSLHGPDGFLSLTDNGELNPNVPGPAGWQTTAGASERFNVRGGAYVHDKSGAALPRYAGTLAKLP